MSSIEQLVKRQIDRWNLQARAAASPEDLVPEPVPCPHITISRERGTGAREIAHLLGDALGWAVLDKQLADYVAEQTQIQRQIIDSVDERFHDQVDSYLRALLQGDFPHAADYAHHLGRTLHIYLRHDPAIVVGRGANILLRDIRQYGLHLRLVAPLAWRISYLVDHSDLTEAAAREEIRRVDAERAFFVKGAYSREITDPLLYDMILNREGIDERGIVQVILSAMRAKGLLPNGPSGQRQRVTVSSLQL